MEEGICGGFCGKFVELLKLIPLFYINQVVFVDDISQEVIFVGEIPSHKKLNHGIFSIFFFLIFFPKIYRKNF